MSLELAVIIIDEALHPDDWMREKNYLNYSLLNDRYLHHWRKILTPDELETLRPVDGPSLAEMANHPTDPARLHHIFLRIREYLAAHVDEFPLAHVVVQEDPGCAHPSLRGSTFWRDLAGDRWFVSALNQDMDHREQVEVTRYDAESGERQDWWVPAEPYIEVGGRWVKLYTRDWYEYCRPDLEGVIGICEAAIKMGKAVLWSLW